MNIITQFYVRLVPRHHSVSSFTLFASYLFVFVCMRLGMMRLFIDVCVAVRPKMHGPSPRRLVDIIACEFTERLFLLRDCVRDCPCSPSLPVTCSDGRSVALRESS